MVIRRSSDEIDFGQHQAGRETLIISVHLTQDLSYDNNTSNLISSYTTDIEWLNSCCLLHLYARKILAQYLVKDEILCRLGPVSWAAYPKGKCMLRVFYLKQAQGGVKSP